MSGYCSVTDVERILQQRNLPDKWGPQTVIDAITAQTEWVEANTRRHWFEAAPDDDPEEVIFTSNRSRDDEHSIPTHGGFVIGASERQPSFRRRSSDALMEHHRPSDRRRRKRQRKQEIRIAFGDVHDSDVSTYTRIRLERKDVSALDALYIADEDGEFVDWTEESGIDIGVDLKRPQGEDAWVRINNMGVAELYIDIHTMDDEFGLPPSFSNAVYVEFEYGVDDLPMGVRRGVAALAAAQLVLDDEGGISITDAGQLVNVETKSEALDRWAIGETSHLEPHLESSW